MSETEEIPLPSGNYLQAIRDSCSSLRKRYSISISPEAIERLLASASFTSSFERVSAAHGLAWPLRFSSHLAELNLIAIISLLNFASGYRVPLHAETGRGAWDNIRALVLAMYITSTTGDGDFLSAKGMQSITEVTVAELMRINTLVEKPHPSLSGVTVGELGGPLYDLIKLITRVLNSTGKTLVDTGYPDLGSFIAQCLKESQAAGPEAAAEIVLQRISQALPAFRDMALVGGQPVYCFKKVLFLIHAIRIRFGSISPSPFPIPMTSHLPVFADNVLPSILVHFGVIDLSSSPELSHLFPPVASEALTSRLDIYKDETSHTSAEPLEEGPTLTLAQAYILRAAAIDACEMIVEHARRRSDSSLAKLTLPDLDMWIWAVAKDRADYRKLPRFVLKDTIFF